MNYSSSNINNNNAYTGYSARPRKSRRPPCNVCGSRKYRKNALGFYFCEQGHQLENYVPEEANPLDLHFVRNIRLKRDSILKNERRARKGMSNVLYGQEAKFLFYQCLQHTLQLQCRALVETCGLPAALETVVRELWVLYLSFCNIVLPADLSASDEMGASQSTQTAMSNEEDKPTTAEWEDDDMDDHLRAMGFEEGEQSTTQYSDDMALSNTSGDEESGTNKSRMRATTMTMTLEDQLSQRRREATAMGKEYAAMHIDHLMQPRLQHSIAICYLACLQLRCPVILADLHRWVYEGKLPYLNAYARLPESYRCRINRFYRVRWQIMSNPSCSNFYRYARLMAEMYHSQYHVEFPPPNIPLLVCRYLSELALPVSLYPVAMYLLQLGRPVLDTRKCEHPSCCIPLVAVMLAANIRYGLHTWCKPMNDLCPAEPLTEWLSKLDQRHKQQQRSPLWIECDIQRWSEENPQDYLNYCDNVLFNKEVLKELNPRMYEMIRDIKNIFQLARNSIDNLDSSKHYRNTVNHHKVINQPKEMIYDNRSTLNNKPSRLYDVLLPAEPFWDQRRWHPGYARLLEYCAKSSGLTMDQLNYQVQAMASRIRRHVTQNEEDEEDNTKQYVLLEGESIGATQEIDEQYNLSFA
ncbi:hypothetical protein BDF22DRAFT_700671 [Syncephalis plumigaleata]|nr:hypothetical protein BDF22DRAFT_700671 [Syncephalis plumigaleata]